MALFSQNRQRALILVDAQEQMRNRKSTHTVTSDEVVTTSPGHKVEGRGLHAVVARAKIRE